MTPDVVELIEDLHGSAAIAVLDPSARIRHWNGGMAELSGLAREDVLGVAVHDLFPQLWSSETDRAILAALRGAPTRITEPFFAAASPAHARELACLATPAMSGGKVVGCSLVVRRRGPGNPGREEVERRFLDMANSSPVLLWMSGPDSLCDFFNQTWLDFSGRTLAQELGVGWTEGIHPEDYQHCINTYMRAFSARVPFEMEYRLRRGDGQHRWLLDRGVPRYTADGVFVGFIGSCVDIDDRRAAEQGTRSLARELEEAHASMEKLLYAASHDLHEPIRMVVNFLEILQQHAGPTLDDRGLRYLGFAREGGLRMASLVEGLLEFARARSRQPRLARVESREIVDLVLADLAGSVASCGAVVQVGELPPVTGDHALLRSLFQNLLSNAIKFRGDVPPRIRVSGQRAGNECRFVVQDNGIGFPPDEAKRVFEMFRRLHPRDERPGNGIGLAIAREIVHRHGGEIWARSDADGGATFTFTIPELAS